MTETHRKRRALYVTHPEVVIDRNVPVADWPLSLVGQQRAKAFSQALGDVSDARILSSTERKARELATTLTAGSSNDMIVQDKMGENDRSATGYLEPAEFESVADQFFAQPEVSVRGWERAIDAQARIVQAVIEAIAEFPGPDLIFCGHGAVGSLLYCHLAGVPIDRKWDQPAPGCWFAFDPDRMAVTNHWKPLEALR